MVGHGGSSAVSYLADPTSPIPSHCASIVATSTLRVKKIFWFFLQVFSAAVLRVEQITTVNMAATVRWTCGCGGDVSRVDYDAAKKSAWKRNVSERIGKFRIQSKSCFKLVDLHQCGLGWLDWSSSNEVESVDEHSPFSIALLSYFCEDSQSVLCAEAWDVEKTSVCRWKTIRWNA